MIEIRPPNPKRVMIFGFPGETPPLKPGHVHPPRFDPPHEDQLLIIYPDDSTP